LVKNLFRYKDVEEASHARPNEKIRTHLSEKISTNHFNNKYE